MTFTAASNAPEGYLDVWLRIPEGGEESEAEANVRVTEWGTFVAEWYLTSVGLVTHSSEFDTYADICAWLSSEGFEGYSA